VVAALPAEPATVACVLCGLPPLRAVRVAVEFGFAAAAAFALSITLCSEELSSAAWKPSPEETLAVGSFCAVAGAVDVGPILTPNVVHLACQELGPAG
jgi:hypothetical protein